MSNVPNPAPREPDPESRKDRRFDTLAALLAAVLAAIVLGALAYGILRPWNATSPVPLPNANRMQPLKTAAPRPDPAVPKATATTAGDGGAARIPAAGR